ncbi:MAG: CoA ester lyase [Actinomycetota bacterium]
MAAIGRLRSLLFAPAVRPDLIAKGPRSGADGIVIDCEDATPPDAKVEARATAREAARELAGEGPLVFVRINAVPTEWFADDVCGALGDGLDGVVVPKVETVGQLDTIGAALDDAGHPDLPVVLGLETVLGVADARQLLTHPRSAGAYFGAEDYVADLGGVRTVGNAEVAVPRAQVAIAGRLAGVPTLDQIVADFRDDDRFTAETAEARAMGFRGKLCIHPAQVALANAGFVPSAEEVDRAQRMLTAYDEAKAQGLGAIAFDGQMVDEPLAAQARAIIEAATPDV